MFKDRTAQSVRDCTLTLHCPEVEIFQLKQNAIRMLGYGTIKINESGQIFLDFICMHRENFPNQLLNIMLPKDPLDDTEYLYLRVKDINNNEYRSDKISFKIDNFPSSLPKNYTIALPSIYLKSKVNNVEENYLYLQFLEKCKIPVNKYNTLESSLNSTSMSWNQSDIIIDDCLVSIIKYEKYTEIIVTGLFDVKTLLDCLKFYIGFSSASMPQFYYMQTVENGDKKEIFSSINNSRKHKLSCSPMVESISNEEYKDHKYHYNTLKNIIILYKNENKYFESIYSQWERVWYSFQSEKSITVLTLSVAIEGLLNDIYIPMIEKKEDKTKIIQEISTLKDKIKSLDLDEKHYDKIINSISFWKKTTAAKAIVYLIGKNILTTEDKSSWNKIRNESAHPKIRDFDLDKQRLRNKEILLCINVFHKLILNTIGFSGPILVFSEGANPICEELIHINVLN